MVQKINVLTATCWLSPPPAPSHFSLSLPAGNLSAAAAFAVAFLGDVLDVAAHVVVVTGLMHTHFQVNLTSSGSSGGGISSNDSSTYSLLPHPM